MMSTATSILELNECKAIAEEHISYFYFKMDNRKYRWFRDLICSTYNYNYCRFDAFYKKIFILRRKYSK